MAFKYRGVAEKEKTAYDFKSIVDGHVFGGTINSFVSGNWIVDESREAFLLKIAQAPFFNPEHIEYFAFYLRGKVGYLKAQRIATGHSLSDAHVIWQDGRLWLPASLDAERNAIAEMLKEAFFEYGTGTHRGSQIQGVEVLPWVRDFDDLLEGEK